MADYQAGIGRTDPMCSLPAITEPILSPASEPPPLDPLRVMIEHLVASVARVEARLDDQDRRSSSSRQSHRPEPDPPNSRAIPRSVEVNMLFIPPYSAISVATQAPPSSAAFLGFGEGWRPNPNGPASSWRQGPSRGLAVQEQHTSWDLPPASRAQPAWDVWGNRFGDTGGSGPRAAWDPSGQRQATSLPFGDRASGLPMKPPRFDGTNVVSWISRVQFYFDHFMLPEEQRLHYAVMLFDPPVAEWVFNYREGSPNVRWSEFLEDVRRRFDPKCFVDYFGVIAKLRQTGSVAEYIAEFEGMLNRVKGVPDGRLVTLYVEGLQQPVRNQVKFQYPPSVAAAIALAVEFDAAIERPVSQPSQQRRQWQARESRPQSGAGAGQGSTQPSTDAQPPRANPAHPAEFSGIPIIKLSGAEKAERTRKGICWYCPDRWAPGHVCKKTFLAYMGGEDDDQEVGVDAQQTEEVVTADLSHIYAMNGKPRAGSMLLQGTIGTEPVQVMVDTGSSHDFLHPRVAEKLKLPLTPIRPFRVYVGNGASLVCSLASVDTKLIIQQETSSITLHILPIHGPDVVLGLDWLHSLQRVMNDFITGTIEFLRDGAPVCLRVTPPEPKEVSHRSASLLMLHADDAYAFELVRIPPASEVAADEIVFPGDLPAAVVDVLKANHSVFSIPTGMPRRGPTITEFTYCRTQSR